MSPHGIPQVIHVSQYDSDFSIQFKLYASVGTLSIESGTTAEIRGTKGSGTGYSASATLNTSNGTVTVAGSEQMTAVAGRNTFEIVLKKSGKVLGSANFILLVERAALDADTITDASVLRELNAIVEGAATATQAAEEAEAAADRAEAAAQTLVIDPTLTLPGQPADAKMVGDKITDLTETVDNFEGISDAVKVALLDIVSHIALWTDKQGQDYYDALYNALYNGEVIPTVEYPDLTTGDIVTGSYYDASGNIVMGGSASCINEKYFEIESGQTYIWIRGFNARVRKSQNTILGQTAVYRVCYYDSEKNFMARHVSNYSDEFNVVEPRYYTLQPPSNAKYFRVSWDMLPIGNIYKSIPNDLYAVIIVLATLNDATIESESTITNNFSVTRNNIDITHSVVYGTDESISVPWADEWVHNIFNVNGGGSPETGEQTETQTRIHNIISFLMKAGDVIHFNGVKAAVRAEKIVDGTIQHTTAWITDNSDFVIGGE